MIYQIGIGVVVFVRTGIYSDFFKQRFCTNRIILCITILGDFYKARWQKWIDARLSELKGETFEEIDWFEWEWEWARKNTSYPVTPAIFEFLSDMLI